MADADIDTKRYDRQIRLWGLDTQRGLVGARVLMLGANGLANEIAKNLVLAGVGHLHFADAGVVCQADLEAGGLFSVTEAHLGVGRAEALASELKAMNPSVDLAHTRSEAHELKLGLLQTYHFIVGTRGVDAVREIGACTALLERHGGGENADPQSAPAPKRHRANGDSGPAVARSNGAHEVAPMRPCAQTNAPPMPKLLAAGTYGLDGFCFFDFGAPTAIIPPKKPPAGEAAPAAGETSSAAQPQTEKALYPTVRGAARVEWAALMARVPKLYYGLQLLEAALYPPCAADKPEAATTKAAKAAADIHASALPDGAPPAAAALLAGMHKQRTRLLESAASNTEAAKLVTDAYLAALASSADVELAPVCAIVGGMIAAEVIKVISGKERPINNAFFFDGETSDGVVQRLGPSFDCAWGLDKGEFKALRAATA